MSIDNDFRKLFFNLSEKNQYLLEQATLRKAFKKNEHLIEPGKKAGVVFVITKGVTRTYITKNTKEITTNFNFEKDFCFPINSYIPDADSDEYIQALTDVETDKIDLNKYDKLKTNNSELIQLEVLVNGIIIVQLAKRLRNFQTMDAKERYLQLIEKEPNIIQKIPINYIASYLGITPGSLSRIRSII